MTSMVSDTKFLEIERKYLLPQGLSPANYLKKMKDLNPSHQSIVSVQDTYFVAQASPGVVYRHRVDEELQHLTVKSLEDNSEVRLEVNLDLGLHVGSQLDRVEAFLRPLKILWSGTIKKSVSAFYYDKVELVYYDAAFGNKKVSCIEIEAKNCSSIDAARNLISEYENLLQVDKGFISGRSLFHILLFEDLKSTIGSEASHWSGR